jgi:hypothetical protein
MHWIYLIIFTVDSVFLDKDTCTLRVHLAMQNYCDHHPPK